jgi:PIN domain nuclease of toxin-antitoxin system
MRCLIDTQVWLWAIAGDSRLGEKARLLIASRKHEPLFSAVSAWEIAIKFRLGKLALPGDPEGFVLSRLARDGIASLAIEPIHALRVASLPDHHRDPFDRLLVAQAQVEGIPLVTADPQMAAYDITRIPAGE